MESSVINLLIIIVGGIFTTLLIKKYFLKNQNDEKDNFKKEYNAILTEPQYKVKENY